MTTVDALLAQTVGEANCQLTGDGSWLVAPGSAAEIAELIGIADRHGVAVVPVGSGAKPTSFGGRRIQISTRRLDQVLHLDETSLVAHVQAGITGLGLERVLARRGLSIGDYPPSFLTSTIGGIIAVRTPGKSSVRHGFFEDAVLGVSAVLADGRTIHTRVAPRRSTGPDLGRALCGSEGSLGFITSVVLRIHRRPEARFVVAYLLPSVEAAVRAVYLALGEEASPAGVRIYDAGDARVHFESVPIDDGQALLLAATAGATTLAACDRDLFTSAVAAEGGEVGDPKPAELWWKRLHSAEPTPAPAPTTQVTATPSRIGPVYRAVCAAAGAAGATVRAHISRFDADGAIIFLTLEGAAGPAALAAVEAAAQSAGGWLLGSRAHRLDPYLRALKSSLDPKGILNPGVFDG